MKRRNNFGFVILADLFFIACNFGTGLCQEELPAVDTSTVKIVISDEKLEISRLKKELLSLNEKMIALNTKFEAKFNIYEDKLKMRVDEAGYLRSASDALNQDLKKISGELSELNLLLVKTEKDNISEKSRIEEISEKIAGLAEEILELKSRIDVISYDKFKEDSERYAQLKKNNEGRAKKIFKNQYLGIIAIFLAIVLKIL